MKIKRTAQSREELPRKIEGMIRSYVDVVLPGRPERTKRAALVGLRMIVERAQRGRPR